MKTNFDGLKDIQSEVKNVATGSQWDYPSIGFSTATGKIYIDSNEVNEFTAVMLEWRQWKEVNTGSEDAPKWIRYGVKTPPSQMEVGVKTVWRTQAVLLLDDGNLYVFGAKSLTAGKLFTNEAKGRGHNPEYQVGIVSSLLETINLAKMQHSVQTAFSSWQFTVKNGAEATNPRSKKKIQAMQWEGFEFVGEEKMIANDNLYTSENLAEWKEDWKNGSLDIAGYETQSNDPVIVEDDPADVIPGFDL